MQTQTKNRALTFDLGQFWLTANGKTRIIPLKEAALCKADADDIAGKILDRVLVKSYPLPKEPLPLFLDPHQVDGVNWVLSRSRSYLAHAPGAGKTCEAIVASLYTASHKGQVVFIVPPALTATWEHEIAKFWGKLYGVTARGPIVSVIQDSARKDKVNWSAEFLIVPDSMLTRDWVLTHLIMIDARFIAIDEASRFKEATSQRTVALFGGKLKSGKHSPGLVYKATHAVLLDGSPMPNRPMELWAPTYAMSPESIDFMTQMDFGFRYCGAKLNEFQRWEFKYSANEAELAVKLQKSFMHVVTEEKLNHPERRRKILLMNEDVRTPVMKTWEKKNLDSDFKFLGINESFSQGDLARYRRELGLRKVDWVASYILDRLKNTYEQMLIFAWHRGVCSKLAQALTKYRPGLIMGGIDLSARAHMVESFQKGDKRIIIGNIAAMGRGLNGLQGADRVVFAEYSWDDETNKQCEKRAARKGRDADMPVRADYIVVPGSFDETILKAVMRKAETVKRVIG